MALHPGSPAVDAGDPANFPSTDQRGVPRAQDGDLDGVVRTEIGAYERQLTVFTVTKTADTNDGVCDSDCSLREAVVRANADAGPDHGIAFDPSLFDSPQTITLTGGEMVPDADGTILIKGRGRAI